MAEAIHLLSLPLKHKPSDISPQGASSGLDADKVDGLHASYLEQVSTLPSVTIGKIVLLLTDGHLYIGTEI